MRPPEAELETLIGLLNTDSERHPEQLAAGRKLIGEVLKKYSGQDLGSGSTVADYVHAIRPGTEPARNLAIFLVRWSAVPGLLPPSNEHNRLDRRIVDLVERELPDLCAEFGIAHRKQTHEKIEVIRTIHGSIMRRLEQFQEAPADIDAFLSLKPPLLRCLNNGLVKAYCNPFGLQYVRPSVEAAFTKIADLAANNDLSFPPELKRVRDYIRELQDYCDASRADTGSGYLDLCVVGERRLDLAAFHSTIPASVA